MSINCMYSEGSETKGSTRTKRIHPPLEKTEIVNPAHMRALLVVASIVHIAGLRATAGRRCAPAFAKKRRSKLLPNCCACVQAFETGRRQPLSTVDMSSGREIVIFFHCSGNDTRCLCRPVFLKNSSEFSSCSEHFFLYYILPRPAQLFFMS